MKALLVLSLCIFLEKQSSFSQVPDFSKVVHLITGDSHGITYLIKNGVKIKKGKVIAWFPKDSLSRKRMRKIADTLNRGVLAAEAFIHAPREWQVQRKGDPCTFYYRIDSFIAHGSLSGFVSIPFYTLNTTRNPWLHEAMHEMLNPKAGNWLDDRYNTKEQWADNMPLWLAEGLPEYISMKVAQQNKLPFYHVRVNTMYGNIDSICRENLKNDKGAYILSFIGKKGTMAELFGDNRRAYAPTFYNCSCSFVKYLADQKGLEVLLRSFSSYPNEHKVLEQLIPSLAEVKSEWLKKVSLYK